jgi:prepilin-type N-terminal cleavage/methylation domain-containing protein
MNKRNAGFSILELLVVVAISLIVTAIAIPGVRRVTASYQLDSGGRLVASMLQSAKMAAVTANQPYYAQFDVPTPRLASASPPPAVRAYLSTDPTAAISNTVSFRPPGALDHSQLDTYLGGGNAANVSIQLGTPIGFNARGTPCVDPAGGFAFRCVQLPAGLPVAFEWFIQHNSTQGWEAITVSPAGQIRSWRMTSPGTWQ